ncbi:IS21 family transposase [Nitratifractor sp.]
MISQEEFTVIHTLKAQGYSIRAIARMTGLDRRTVSRRLKQSERKPYAKREYPSKLDRFKPYIQKRLEEALPKRIPSTEILEEIVLRGYDGKLRILQEYMGKWYTEHGFGKAEDPIVRFETKPGYQAQVDWTVIRGGKSPIYAFVMLLSYSRAPFVYFTDNMRQDTWQRCHEKAFVYFGGVPQTILYDNLKSVVIKRDKYGKGKHGFNDAFLDFSKGWFEPRLCRPYRAQTKGKVERFNRYLKENFYIPLKASLKGSGVTITPDLLNLHVFGWIARTNERVHATTLARPTDRLQEERKYLRPYRPEVSAPVKLESFTTNRSIPAIMIDYQTRLQEYEAIVPRRIDHAS